jgi:hypothetical protein
MRELIGLIGITTWLSGIVLASGFCQTLFTIFIFPYAWYLAIELIMKMAGLL